MYCHGPVGTTQLVLYKEVNSIVSFKKGFTVDKYLKLVVKCTRLHIYVYAWMKSHALSYMCELIKVTVVVLYVNEYE